MKDMALRIILAQMVKGWEKQAQGSGAIAASARTAYLEAAAEVALLLRDTAAEPAAVPRYTMEVTVFGDTSAGMAADALSSGRQVFRGMDVSMSALYIRHAISPGERAMAATGLQVADVRLTATPAEVAEPFAEGTCQA